MEIKKLRKYEAKSADTLLLIQVVVFACMLVIFAVQVNSLGIIVSAVILAGYGFTRLMKGPLSGPTIIEIRDSTILFHDQAFGISEFVKSDIDEIRIVGPIKNQRIRVVTKAGKEKDVFSDPWGRRFERTVAFLGENLPEKLALNEDDPPTCAEAIRRDY
jgi:hypothetical protein